MTPATWLTGHRQLLPRGGSALDVACGRGRHALWLAAQGFVTHGIDRDQAALAAMTKEAQQRGLQIVAHPMDLEVPGIQIGAALWDLIVVFHYLHRPLFPALLAALEPGGVLVYETFTRAQAIAGKPTNPDFLLRPGELLQAVAPLEILAAREGEFDGRMVASVIARRPSSYSGRFRRPTR